MRPCFLLGALLAFGMLAGPARAQDTAVETGVPVATFDQIVAGKLEPDTWRVYQWRGFEHIYAIQFENYRLQGEALNRVTMYIEKYGQRGTVPTWRQLNYYLRQQNLSMENLYSAHDYRTADLARFYNAIDDAGDALSDIESGLRGTLTDIGLIAWNENRERWAHTGDDAVLSIATRYLGNEQPSCRVMGRRDRVFEVHALYHETRHGFYFTDPAYAQICRAYWQEVLGESDRQLFRLVLKAMDYDSGDEELMINEWQAYLLTPSYEFVGATAVTSALLQIASGRYHPSNLTSEELNYFVGSGPGLAIDVERWMIDDLRKRLGEQWNTPTVAEVSGFRLGR